MTSHKASSADGPALLLLLPLLLLLLLLPLLLLAEIMFLVARGQRETSWLVSKSPLACHSVIAVGLR